MKLLPRSKRFSLRSTAYQYGWACLALIATTPVAAQQNSLEVVRQAIRHAVDDATPLEALRSRSEADEDHLHASSLFAEGRVLLRRDQLPEALAKYERAYRYSNRSQTILAEIVPLAFRLGRFDEACRYALHLTPQTQLDPFVLRRLAMHLTERESYNDALRLYDLAVAADRDTDDAPPGLSVITQFEMGRLRYLNDDFTGSAKSFRHVVTAIDQPEERPADQPAIEALLRDGSVTYALMAES
ncbi:MAG: hypothetical protein KDA92_15545, partial [Planctomycetales bacterium]|nr:hypothetical protein [Planctomycetales bacterium]